MASRHTIFVSQIVGQPMRDETGDRIATIQDVIVRLGGNGAYPPVTGLVARINRRTFFVPFSQVRSLSDSGAELGTFDVNVKPFERLDGEILLARDVMDKQLVDVDGRRVVRVNDIQLAQAGPTFRVVGVDVSARGILRRLLPRGMVREEGLPVLLDWADVEYFASHVPVVQLKVSHSRLAKLHPRDIARLVDQLAYPQGAEILESLDEETAADTLEEVAPERQADLIQRMDEERAADILEEMGPDEAADLLADLPEDKAEDILAAMEPEESEDVRELMVYGEDTAGGMMTSEFLTIAPDLTVGPTLDALRAIPDPPEMLYDLYVVDDPEEPHLLGTVTLRDLVLALPAAVIADVMDRDFQHVDPDTPAAEVVQRIADYNMLALPVLDDTRLLLGVVTVDDAIERLRPVPRRERFPRVLS
ncbi:MAG TPA: CBS domain-containing protein [Thermomicrobiaceae bacterium]|nr:CBS domain-containing protein [Thermomicrobiaceae bacterium]